MMPKAPPPTREPKFFELQTDQPSNVFQRAKDVYVNRVFILCRAHPMCSLAPQISACKTYSWEPESSRVRDLSRLPKIAVRPTPKRVTE
jgi:hypothetical protein